MSNTTRVTLTRKSNQKVKTSANPAQNHFWPGLRPTNDWNIFYYSQEPFCIGCCAILLQIGEVIATRFPISVGATADLHEIKPVPRLWDLAEMEKAAPKSGPLINRYYVPTKPAISFFATLPSQSCQGRSQGEVLMPEDDTSPFIGNSKGSIQTFKEDLAACPSCPLQSAVFICWMLFFSQ